MRKRSLFILLVCSMMVHTSFKSHPDLAERFPAEKPGLKAELPVNFFSSPVNRAIKLSGTFGELRANHFHAGIDIKPSAGVPGDKIYAAGEGFISRIRVEPTGYGNVIMIQHPNGLSTLYAHLEKFTPQITAYMQDQQRALKTNDVDLRVPPGVFPVHAGDHIAYMGNTGASRGAHLHFEVRETESDMAINPLLFDLPVSDRMQPWMNSIKVYDLDEQQESIKESVLPLLKLRNGVYKLGRDTLMVATERTAFAVCTYDSHDSNWNRNGIYSLRMLVDDVVKYEFNLDSMYFEESRYCNAHMDFSERVRRNSFFHRCFTLPGNKLPIYSTNEGIIELREDRAQKITIESGDRSGNVSKAEFWVKRNSKLPIAAKVRKYDYEVAFDKSQYIAQADASFHFPVGTFYQNAYLQFTRKENPFLAPYSAIYKIGDALTPIHQPFQLAFKGMPIPEHLRSKAYIAEMNAHPIPSFCGNAWSGDSIVGQSRNFGSFCVQLDTVAPKVKPIIFGANMSRASVIAFNLSDNIKYPSKLKGISYEATIDGQWVIMNYDPRNGSLKMPLKAGQYAGEHTLRIEARDLAGNVRVFQSKFSR